MSIHLDTGFCYRDPEVTFEDVFDHLHAWRAQLREMHQADLARLLARDTSRMIDREATAALLRAEVTPSANPLSAVRNDIIDRQRRIRTSGLRDPEVDFEFQVVIYPESGIFLGLVFCEQSRWIRSFLDDPNLSSMPYWDNTDRPDELSEADWDARRDLWLGIFDRDPHGRASQAGATFEMSPPNIFPPIEMIVEAQPRFEDRMDHIAREIVMDRAIPRDMEVNDAIHKISQMQSRMDTPAGRAARVNLAHEIAPLLKPVLSEQDLKGW